MSRKNQLFSWGGYPQVNLQISQLPVILQSDSQEIWPQRTFFTSKSRIGKWLNWIFLDILLFSPNEPSVWWNASVYVCVSFSVWVGPEKVLSSRYTEVASHLPLQRLCCGQVVGAEMNKKGRIHKSVSWNTLIYIKVDQSVCFHAAQNIVDKCISGSGIMLESKFMLASTRRSVGKKGIELNPKD